MTKYLVTIIIVLSVVLVGCNSSDDNKVKKLNDEGIDFMEQQNFSSALVKFQEALKLEQSEESKSQVYRNLSTVFFNMDEMDSSLMYSKKAFEIAPKDSYMYFLNKAEYNLMSEKVKEAIPLFEKAMILEPEKMESYSNLSLIYNGNYGDEFINLPKALKCALKAFELNPSPGNEEQLASVYFQMENFKKSTFHYSELMKRFPEVKIYQLYAGNSLYSQGKTDEGMALMEDAAARDEKCRQLLDELMTESEE